MLFSGESAFANFIADAFAVFIFILWFWLFITTASDLFRRKDTSGFGKVLWVILLIVLPYIGIFAYIITQGGGMADRRRSGRAGGVGTTQTQSRRFVEPGSIARPAPRACASSTCST